MRKFHLFTWPALAVLILDQVTKAIVLRTMAVHTAIPVIDGFFNLVHVRNRGMAFGIFNRLQGELGFYLLVAATLGAIAVLITWVVRLPAEETTFLLGLSLVMGGALGNLTDRLRHREVVDFLDFHLGPYHWPAFNTADTAITAGIFWIAGCLLFKRPPADPRPPRGSSS